jgi:Alpha/beta hydrolase domain
LPAPSPGVLDEDRRIPAALSLAGLLAVRDFGAHLRNEHAGVFAYGQSQSGRFLREFLFEGLNLAEDGRQVFDGLLAEIASARRGEFNRRYAQPGLAAPMMPEYGPPCDSSSLLDRQRGRGGVPTVFFVNSAAEYWRGDGALVHQDAATGADLPEDPDVRAYLVSGTDHIGNMPGWKRTVPLARPPHLLDQGPVVKALFVQLREWALDGAAPTPSMVPRQSDGTAASRENVLESFAASTRPDPAVLPYTPQIDPDVVEWPLPLGEPRVAHPDFHRS